MIHAYEKNLAVGLQAGVVLPVREIIAEGGCTVRPYEHGTRPRTTHIEVTIRRAIRKVAREEQSLVSGSRGNDPLAEVEKQPVELDISRTNRGFYDAAGTESGIRGTTTIESNQREGTFMRYHASHDDLRIDQHEDILRGGEAVLDRVE